MPSNEQRRAAAKRKLERQIARRAERAKRRRIINIAAVLVAVLAVGGGVYLIATSGGDEKKDQQADPAEQVDKPKDIPTKTVALPKRTKPLPATTSCEYKKSPQPAAKKAKIPPTKNVSTKGTVTDTLETSVGAIPLTLDRSLAPCAVNSFVSLSEQGFFNDTSCHRLTTSGIQVLQCGDPTGQGTGGPGYSFADETLPTLKYGRGILAMANSGPDTNGSQFFIVYGEASQLPPDYTVFGSIGEEGLKTVDKVAKAGAVIKPDPTTGQARPGDGKPKMEVRITKATVQA